MKIHHVLALLVMMTSPAFSHNTTFSLYGGVNGNLLTHEIESQYDWNDSMTSYGGGLLGISGFFCPEAEGFYLSSSLSLCVTISLIEEAFLGILTGNGYDIRYGLLTEEYLSAGRRWPGLDRKMGFFIGAGPASQQLWGIDEDDLFLIGGLLEAGFQTNRVTRVGYHLKATLSWYPFSNVKSEKTHSIGLGIYSGISWRRGC